MKLHKDIIEEYKKVGEGSMFYGEPVADFNRDELLACIGYLSSHFYDLKKTSEHERNLLFEALKK